jgi:hypothetical protein
MPQILTVSDELILIPTEPEHLFSPATLLAIAAPDSVDATCRESLRKLDPSSPLPHDVRIEPSRRGILRTIVFARRRLSPEIIAKLQAILSDPNNYLGMRLLDSWSGEFTLSFWKDGIPFPISITNSFTKVKEDGRLSFWPVGSAGRLSGIIDEIFPERSLYEHGGRRETDRNRNEILDSELRALAESSFR